MIRRAPLAALSVSLSLFLFSCHDHPTDPCGEPEYGGIATDEAWLALVDGEKNATADDAKAVTITAPTQGEVLARGGAAPLVTWTPGAVGSSTMTRRFVPASRRFATRVPCADRSPFKWLGRLLEGEAHAHAPPITGPVFYLHFTVPGRACEVRVFTSETRYQMSAAAFTALKAATGAISLSITSAYLRDNRITEGPYKPTAARTFTVGP